MSRFLDAIPDVLVVLGLVAVALGAGLVFLPAGLVVGGVEAVGLGYVLAADQLRREQGEADAA